MWEMHLSLPSSSLPKRKKQLVKQYENGAVILENSLKISQNFKHRIIIGPKGMWLRW